MAWTNPATVTAGSTLAAAFWNEQVRDQFNALAPFFSSMASYTPALTATTTDPTLGTGSSVGGSFVTIGKMTIVRFSISFGTSGAAAGSGTYRVSLPASAPMSTDILLGGSGFLRDASDSNRAYTCLFERATASTLNIITSTTNFGLVANAAPFTWANNDAIFGSLTYWTT